MVTNNRYNFILPLNGWTGLRIISKRLLLILPVAVVVGLFVAFFLWLLDWASQTRWQHLSIIFFLPFAGIFIGWLYKLAGKEADRGNNLILEEIHVPTNGIPARMTPLILISTIITHLFGGSAGREGTAVQMGGSIAAQFGKWFHLNTEDKRIFLLAGMSAGFGAVFGTPVAGAIWALEVLSIGKIRYTALLPCLFAGIVADITCASCGIHHTHYTISFITNKLVHFGFISYDLALSIKVVIASALFGMAAYLFARLTQLIKLKSKDLIKTTWLIPVIGALLVIGFSFVIGTFDYLGLGVTNPNIGGVSIVSAFSPGGATYFSWLIKLLLTAITLGMGFKGGEVTPLFFIGATLGNTLAFISHAPTDLFAGLGFIAVFAGATNTPIACTLMGVELFGGENILYYAIACFVAYYFSGHRGIYTSQKVTEFKY